MIRISKKHLEEIGRLSVSALPGECCGLLIGTAEKEQTAITRLVPSANRAESTDRFEIDPALHLKYQRQLRGSGEQIIGHYHSHPAGDCTPSDRDLADASCPGWIWLITGVSDQKKTLTKAWWFLDDAVGRRFKEDVLVIE